MTPLFSLRALHDYFADGLCGALQWQPSASTRQQLARYQLVFRGERGGGTVYYRAGISPLDQYLETAPMVFWLLNDDLAFGDYTELVQTAGGMRYFDNLRAAPDGTLNDGPCLPCKPARFSVPLNPSRRAAALAVRAQLAPEPPVWQAISPDVLLANLPIDLQGLDEGRYVVQIDGAAASDFWLGAPPHGAWGMVAIYVGGGLQSSHLPPDECMITADGRVRTRTFMLRFAARRLPWRYSLIGQPLRPLDWSNYVLTAIPVEGAAVDFIGASAPALDGQPVYRFTSAHALALSERPGERIKLQLQPRPGTRHATTLRLPYPQPANVGGLSDGELHAEVYIYL